MPLSELQINDINAAFLADPAAQEALLRAQPNGAGLKLVADQLFVLKLEAANVAKLFVFYSFDPMRNSPSRSGATMDDQPVRGSLGHDDGVDVSALNINPSIIGALCFPEVFPSRLDAVKEQWIDCGKKTFPDMNPAEIRTAALRIGLRLSLKSFADAPDGPCKGSSCPVPVTVTGK